MRALLSFLLLFAALPALAQQKIGYIDSEYIFSRVPEYNTIQQQIERQAQQWRQEVERRQNELDERFREYQARELLYTAEERRQRREDIIREEQDIDRLRVRYFGPEGELFTQQQTLMRPLQERLLTAIEAVATADNYDYVFDRSGEFLFVFLRPQHDLSDRVLLELGIDVSR